jgi:hypothetical protein
MYAIVKVGITTFAAYVLSSTDNILTADKAFVSLALFNLLRNPLNAFPNVISSLTEVNQNTLAWYIFQFLFRHVYQIKDFRSF